ncbi:hypothetical protein D6T65_15130 [Arthrobacter frigidicola]|nr:hypothetical protein D6T65_15130 [Arthrobacter frigidicola]
MPRLAADAVNQLRSAIEHALYAEVEHLTGRSLDERESQAIEMPIKTDAAGLKDWFQHRRRRSLPVLHSDGSLGQRIEALQPYHQAPDHQVHPLKLLAEYSNLSKHRTPAVAAVRLGAIIPDIYVPGLRVREQDGRNQLLEVDDVLVSVPEGNVVPIDIWPMIGIRRPHTGEWIVLPTELKELELWVRTVALPTIIAGGVNCEQLPPYLDISLGYQVFEDALSNARNLPAADRYAKRIVGEGLRSDFPRMFGESLPSVSPDVIKSFVSVLSDDKAIEIMERYARVAEHRGGESASNYLGRLVSESTGNEAV